MSKVEWPTLFGMRERNDALAAYRGRVIYMLAVMGAIVMLPLTGIALIVQPLALVVIAAVLAYMLINGASIIGLTLVMLLSGLDLVTAFSAVIVCVNNIGPGLGSVGPASHFGVLSDFQLWVLSLAMLLGRLELMSVLVLLTPQFWQNAKQRILDGFIDDVFPYPQELRFSYKPPIPAVQAA